MNQTDERIAEYLDCIHTADPSETQKGYLPRKSVCSLTGIPCVAYNSGFLSEHEQATVLLQSLMNRCPMYNFDAKTLLGFGRSLAQRVADVNKGKAR